MFMLTPKFIVSIYMNSGLKIEVKVTKYNIQKDSNGKLTGLNLVSQSQSEVLKSIKLESIDFVTTRPAGIFE